MGADHKRKEARKRKFGAQVIPGNPESQPTTTATKSKADDATEQQNPRKKHKKGAVPLEPIAKTRAADEKDAEDTSAVASYPREDDDQIQLPQDSADAKSQRFIVFIGNLPFSATDASIAQHFAKVHPTSIRHRTDKATGKSKGFAFLEFEAYDRMKTCLKLYHHSTFEEGDGDGKDGGKGRGRRLNVELTVGGGGRKSKDRKAKLRDKNAKLNEERQRRAEEERKQEGAAAVVSEGKKTKTKTGSKKGSSRVKGGEIAAEPEVKVAAEPPSMHDVDQDGDIHPSRRSRMRRT